MYLCVRFLKLSLCVGFFLMQVPTVFGAQLHVPGEYATIQEGIDAASAGDEIIVADGTYVENISVRTSVTVRSENGAMNTFVQAENSGHHVFGIQADQVTIEGFTVSGTLESDAAGIYLSSGFGASILRDNQVGMPGFPNVYGIILMDSHDNYLEGNSINNNIKSGIAVVRSSGNTLKGNTIVQNDNIGIDCTMAVDNNFIENTIASHEGGYGILLHVSSDNLVSRNEFSENYSDIRIRYSSNRNKIVNNTCINTSYTAILVDHESIENKIFKNACIADDFGQRGVYLWATGANEVFENSISGYANGISFQGATDSRVYSNICNGNLFAGIDVNSDSQENQIYANQCNGNSGYGINVNNSSLNEVSFNICNDNQDAGFALSLSQDNLFFRNSATANGVGASIENSSNNRVFLNSFAGNDAAVFSRGSETIWQGEQAVAYLFQGTTYSGFLGNFYSDHDLTDSDGDGVTDLPKDHPDIDLDDTYPLVMNHTFFKTASSDGDFDGDVDGQDAADFITAFLLESITADLNQDAVFDVLDIEGFAAVFGR